MDYVIRVSSKTTTYYINLQFVETIRCLADSVRLEFNSGRVDAYYGDDARQILEQIKGIDITRYTTTDGLTCPQCAGSGYLSDSQESACPLCEERGTVSQSDYDYFLSRPRETYYS